MKKLLLLLAVVFATPVFAQDDYESDDQTDLVGEVETSDEEVVDGIVKKQHVKAKKPLMPAYVREANVLWAKTVWRIIDLRQKQNLYLYYPTQDIDERKSLTRVLYDAVTSGEITAFNPDNDNEFESKYTPYQVCARLLKADDDDAEVDSVVTVNPETGKEEVHYSTQVNADGFTSVHQIKVKEVWYFDKKYTCMKVQIIGLCPVAFKEKGGTMSQFDLFWVYYPAAAGVLSRQEAYSYRNDAQRVSLRDKLETRQFDSYIYRESNVYDNRVITAIASNGIDQNLEAQRIQADIFQHEHDVWEY